MVYGVIEISDQVDSFIVVSRFQSYGVFYSYYNCCLIILITVYLFKIWETYFYKFVCYSKIASKLQNLLN